MLDLVTVLHLRKIRMSGIVEDGVAGREHRSAVTSLIVPSLVLLLPSYFLAASGTHHNHLISLTHIRGTGIGGDGKACVVWRMSYRRILEG